VVHITKEISGKELKEYLSSSQQTPNTILHEQGNGITKFSVTDSLYDKFDNNSKGISGLDISSARNQYIFNEKLQGFIIISFRVFLFSDFDRNIKWLSFMSIIFNNDNKWKNMAHVGVDEKLFFHFENVPEFGSSDYEYSRKKLLETGRWTEVTVVVNTYDKRLMFFIDGKLGDISKYEEPNTGVEGLFFGLRCSSEAKKLQIGIKDVQITEMQLR